MLSLRNTALYIFEDVKVSVATEYFFDRLIFFFKKVVKGDWKKQMCFLISSEF